ncbi:MAG TPA: VOC family protein [Rhizomicrobium sp.]|jgi:catechol 2,3-dioxygenase-like lactoylglutathione lyase family enzyme
MATLGYATVGSNDLDRAKAFYTPLLGAFGITPLFPHPTGGQIYGRDGAFVFGVIGAYDKQPATVGNGTMISFRCDSTAEVDAFHAKALELGGKDEGAPGFRAPKFYMSYFRDLDGNKMCAYHAG